MTVSAGTERRTSVVGSNAAGQTVPYTFYAKNTSDLIVRTRVTATGVETTLVETTEYTVTQNSDLVGGYVTVVSAVATTSEIHIIRYSPISQLLDLAQSGTFNAELLEAALDKLTYLVIENYESISRTMTVPDTDDADDDLELPNSIDRASAYLFFDADGLPTAVSAVDTSLVTISSWVENNFLNVADADAGLTALGGGTKGVAIFKDTTSAAVLTELGITAFVQTLLDDTTAAAFMTTLGITAFAQTILDDADAATARETLGAIQADDIVVYNGDVVTHNGNVLTYS